MKRFLILAIILFGAVAFAGTIQFKRSTNTATPTLKEGEPAVMSGATPRVFLGNSTAHNNAEFVMHGPTFSHISSTATTGNVTLAGGQTVTGAKTFSQPVTLTPLSDTDAVELAGTNAAGSSYNWDILKSGGAYFAGAVTLGGISGAITDSTSVTSSTIAASATAVKSANDNANIRLLATAQAADSAKIQTYAVDSASPSDQDIFQYSTGSAKWQHVTPSTIKTSLALVKGDVGLGNVANVDTTSTGNITDYTNKRFVTDAQITVIGNTSGTNTGDETASTIAAKLGQASGSRSGYLNNSDWSYFNTGSYLGTTALQDTTPVTRVTVKRIAAGTIAAHTLVKGVAAGQVGPVVSDTEGILGVAENAATVGNEVDVTVLGQTTVLSEGTIPDLHYLGAGSSDPTKIKDSGQSAIGSISMGSRIIAKAMGADSGGSVTVNVVGPYRFGALVDMIEGGSIPTSKTVVGTNSSGQLVDASSATLGNNITGTAANLSGTPALPNGTTATTQSASDNSIKLATTAYADAGDAGLANLAGRSGGQTLNGDTASGGNLTLHSTAHATRGSINAAGLVLNEATFANTLNVGQTTSAVTDLLINPATKASGNLMDLQIGGVSKCKVDYQGAVTATGVISSGSGISVTAGTITQVSSHVGILFDATFTGTYNQTGTSQQTASVQIKPVYNQPSATSVANTDFLVNRTETSYGTTPGKQRLLDLGTGGGSFVSKFNVDNKGHNNVNGTAPSLTSCGSSPTIQSGSNDHAGTFTIGSTGTGCVATFGTAYANTPTCVISSRTVANLTSYSPSTTAITIVGAAGVYDYNCSGLNE